MGKVPHHYLLHRDIRNHYSNREGPSTNLSYIGVLDVTLNIIDSTDIVPRVYKFQKKTATSGSGPGNMTSDSATTCIIMTAFRFAVEQRAPISDNARKGHVSRTPATGCQATSLGSRRRILSFQQPRC